MALHKNILEIIQVQNSCKGVMQELYNFDTRPNDTLRQSYKNAKIDEAIRLDILEYDSYDDVLSLSADTYEYYKTRLGHNNETTIHTIDDKLHKLTIELNYYNTRLASYETPEKEIRSITKLLNQIPSLLRYNFYTISSNSIFAFKNEPNFEIKMEKLTISKGEIEQLIEASQKIYSFLQENHAIFKSMKHQRINFLILKIKKSMVELEISFRLLYEEIKNFINKSIKDGAFIKKLQRLRELKAQNLLLQKTDIEEKIAHQKAISTPIRDKKIHPDDRIFDYIDTIESIITQRKIKLQDTKAQTPLSYDITKEESIQKVLYNYPKLHKAFLAQEDDLATFLSKSIEDSSKILGIFIRLLKNYFRAYEVDDSVFIVIDERKYVQVRKK